MPGLVILSRWPLRPGGTLEGDRQGWGRRGVAWATVATPEGPLVVAAVHLGNPFADGPLRFGRRRDRHLARTCAQLARLSAGGAPVVAAGDFNVTDRERGWDCVEAWGTDAWDVAGVGRGGTWRPVRRAWVPGLLRIDHVVVAGRAEPVRQAVRCGVGHGDHCPLVTHLRVGAG